MNYNTYNLIYFVLFYNYIYFIIFTCKGRQAPSSILFKSSIIVLLSGTIENIFSASS